MSLSALIRVLDNIEDDFHDVDQICDSESLAVSLIVAGTDLLGVATAAIADLRAPKGGVEVVSRGIPVLGIDVGLESGERGQARGAKVVVHVDEDVVGALAANTAPVDALLALASNVDLFVEETVALRLSEAATSVDFVEVATDLLNVATSTARLEVEAVANRLVASGVSVSAQPESLALLDELGVGLASSAGCNDSSEGESSERLHY